MTKGKCTAFDISCVHAPYYTETTRRITEWAFFRKRGCLFGLFLPLLRVSAHGTKRCKNRLDAAESTGVYVTYLILRASFLPSLQPSLPFSPLFTFFSPLACIFFALFRLGEVFGELSDQRDETDINMEKCVLKITLLWANWIQNLETDFGIRKSTLRDRCREV